MEILTNATSWYDQTFSNYYNQVPKLIYEDHHSHFKGKWMTFPMYYYTVQRQGKEKKEKEKKTFESYLRRCLTLNFSKQTPEHF